MSKKNVVKNEKYNVDNAWKREEPSNVDDCLIRLVKLFNSVNKLECHGASKLKHEGESSIRSKFDLRFYGKDNNKKNDEKDKEKKLLDSFREKAYPFLPPEARQFIDVAHFRWNTYYNTGTMFIGRHYRLPTRCVDWTIDPFIALFFSCCNDFDKPGVVWWMDYGVFSYAIAKQWPLFYGKKKKIEEDFEKDFTEEKDKDIITRFHYKCLVDRPNKQKAHILLSGQYNVQHDKKIYDLGVRKCGRIVIKPKIKQKLLDKLALWGIDEKTLGIKDSKDLNAENIKNIVSDVAGNILGSDDNKNTK